MVYDYYSLETWTHVYTNGLTTAAIQDRGTVYLICHTTRRIWTISVATVAHCTNYNTEVGDIMWLTVRRCHYIKDTTCLMHTCTQCPNWTHGMEQQTTWHKLQRCPLLEYQIHYIWLVSSSIQHRCTERRKN